MYLIMRNHHPYFSEIVLHIVRMDLCEKNLSYNFLTFSKLSVFTVIYTIIKIDVYFVIR